MTGERNKLAEDLIAKGISRLADAGRTLGIAFNRRPTDDEMRKIHDLLRDPSALREPEQTERIIRLQENSARDKDRIHELEQANTALQIKNVMLETKREPATDAVLGGAEGFRRTGARHGSDDGT